MLHDQEAVVVLLQDGHELEDCKGAAHFQGGEVAVQPAEDARVVAADEEDLVALQFRWLLRASASISTGAMRTLNGLGEQGDGGEEFDFHDREMGGCGDMRARQGGGAKVKGKLFVFLVSIQR